jgi:hypothetical protein
MFEVCELEGVIYKARLPNRLLNTHLTAPPGLTWAPNHRCQRQHVLRIISRALFINPTQPYSSPYPCIPFQDPDHTARAYT